MKFSIIIPSRSEGRLLSATVGSVTDASQDSDYEVIVVDDESDDYSGDDLELEYAADDRVTVLRNSVRKGVAGSRNRGAKEATGDTLIFIDAHSFVPDGWLTEIESATAKHNPNPFQSTIYTAIIGSIYASDEVPDEEVFSYQARFDNATLQQTVLSDGKPSDNPYPVQLIEGAVMIFGADHFNRLGGFDEGLKPPWGQEAHEICFRNWMLGGECRIIPSLLVRTLYRETFPYAGVMYENLIHNKLRLAYSLFSDDRFERVVDALMLDETFGQFTPAAIRMLLAGDTPKRRRDLRKQFTRTDAEVCAMFTNSRW